MYFHSSQSVSKKNEVLTYIPLYECGGCDPAVCDFGITQTDKSNLMKDWSVGLQQNKIKPILLLM
jgi:hypothetical protein